MKAYSALTLIFPFLTGVILLLGSACIWLIRELDRSDAYAESMAKSYSSCESKRMTLVFKEYQCRKGYPKEIHLEDVFKEGNL